MSLWPAEKGSTLVWGDCQHSIECSSMWCSQHHGLHAVADVVWDTARLHLRLHGCQRAWFLRRDLFLLLRLFQISWFTIWGLHCLSCEMDVSARGKLRVAFGRWEENLQLCIQNIFMWVPWKIWLSLDLICFFWQKVPWYFSMSQG